jgi:hypothetical protein
MPRIPVGNYNPSVSAPTANTPLTQPVPEAAFSSAPGDAMQNLGNSMFKVGQALGKVAIEQRKEKVQKQALDINNKIDDALQSKVLVDPKNGLLVRQGDAANGIDQEFITQAAQLKKSALEGVNDPAVVQLVNELHGRSFERMRDQVITHQARQYQAAFKDSNESAINNAASSATVFKTGQDLIRGVGEVVAMQTAYLTKTGMPIPAIAEANRKLSAQIVKDAITNKYDSDPATAQAAFAAVATQIDPASALDIKNILLGKAVENGAADLWNRVGSGMVNPADGTYNPESLKAVVDSVPNLTALQRDKYQQYFDAKAADAQRQAKEAKAARSEDFQNKVLDIRDKGGTLDQAFSLAKQTGRTLTEIEDNKNYAIKLFNPDRPTDINTEIALRNGIEDGSITEQKIIDQNANKLSKEKYASLTELLRDRMVAPRNPADKMVWDKIELMAQDKFGNAVGSDGKAKRKDEFLSALETKSRTDNIVGPALLDEAKKMIGDIKTGAWFWQHEPAFQLYNKNRSEAEQKTIDYLTSQGVRVTQERVNKYLRAYPYGPPAQ